MKRYPSLLMLTVTTAAAVLVKAGGRSTTAQDGAKYNAQVPDGLSFSEVRGYEAWQVVPMSVTDELLNVIVANPTAITAYQAGIPGNDQSFPDRSRLVKIQWTPKKSTEAPFSVLVPDTLKDVATMVTASGSPQGGGWGLRPVRLHPGLRPLHGQRHRRAMRRGHTNVVTKDYVFTAFWKR